jgi:hypothetical protein
MFNCCVAGFEDNVIKFMLVYVGFQCLTFGFYDQFCLLENIFNEQILGFQNSSRGNVMSKQVE